MAKLLFGEHTGALEEVKAQGTSGCRHAGSQSDHISSVSVCCEIDLKLVKSEGAILLTLSCTDLSVFLVVCLKNKSGVILYLFYCQQIPCNDPKPTMLLVLL